ncbi:MAG: sulfurtransferase [Acidobacteria bacterium]|nr:sulfurtransferase [Acidobacteriota bacterium]
MRHAALALICVVVSCSGAFAQAGAPSLITPSQLEPMLGDPALVLLHVGDKAGYDAEHLPGARHVEVRAVSAAPQDGGLTTQLPEPDVLESQLEVLGISNTSRIVLYMAKDAVAPVTRIVFTLDYAGLGGQTMVLDGGLPAWKAAGKQVTADVPPAPVPGTLTLRLQPERVADLPWVQAHAGKQGTVVLDARLTEFYTGDSDNNGRIPRPGHVPGAVSAPYPAFLRPDGTFKSREELDAMLKAAGATPGGTVATYCHVGQTATVPYFAARVLGYDARVFDGSYEEWARTSNVPVKTGPTP